MNNDGTARPTIDWRDWIAFLGYVLATAVVVSVVLGSLVLVISMQADTGAARNTGAPLGAAIAPPARSQPAMPVLPGAPAAARNEAAPGLPAGATK